MWQLTASALIASACDAFAQVSLKRDRQIAQAEDRGRKSEYDIGTVRDILQGGVGSFIDQHGDRSHHG